MATYDEGELQEGKYELTGDTMLFIFKDVEYKLHRIRALIDLTSIKKSNVKKGDLGGWIQYEYNLPQAHGSWIHDEAKCFGNGIICSDAQMYDHSIVTGYSMLWYDTVIDHEVICYNSADINIEYINGRVTITAFDDEIKHYREEFGYEYQQGEDLPEGQFTPPEV